MNPAKVNRACLQVLTDLPNIGPAMATDLRRLGIQRPQDLQGQEAFALYHELCLLSGSRQDPCVLDVLLSVVDFIHGGEAKPWWAYTAQRKRDYAGI